MNQNTVWAFVWTGDPFLFVGSLSDSFADFIRPLYIAKRRGKLSLRTSGVILALTLPRSFAWSTINLKFIQAAFCLWSLTTSSCPISRHALTHRPYSSIALGNSLAEIIIGTLVCMLEARGTWVAAMALERKEARLVAEARLHCVNANRAQRPRFTRAQNEEKRARGDFGKLLTEEGCVQDGA
ncbi:hypothetical protein PSPO01_11788 [Paraphaeosphaeria sporulosa]